MIEASESKMTVNYSDLDIFKNSSIIDTIKVDPIIFDNNLSDTVADSNDSGYDSHFYVSNAGLDLPENTSIIETEKFAKHPLLTLLKTEESVLESLDRFSDFDKNLYKGK